MPVPGGAIAVIELAEFTVKLRALTEPNLTAVAPLKSLPLMRTDVPPAEGPALGLTAVTVGGLGKVAKLRLDPSLVPPELVATIL